MHSGINEFCAYTTDGRTSAHASVVLAPFNSHCDSSTGGGNFIYHNDKGNSG
jgi:hypothetical protein